MYKYLLPLLLLTTTSYAEHTFSVGATGAYMKLNSKDTGISQTYMFSADGGSTFTGDLWGGFADYSYSAPCAPYFNLNSRTLTGTLTSNTSPDRKVTDTTCEGRVGYTLGKAAWSITPYTGFGFHYLRQLRVANYDVAASTQKHYTYYAPIGMIARFTHNRFTIALDAKATPQVDPTMYVSFVEGLRWNLRRKVGVEVKLPLIYQFYMKKRFHFSTSLEPFFSFHQHSQSDRSPCLTKVLTWPAEERTFWGVNLAFAVKY